MGRQDWTAPTPNLTAVPVLVTAQVSITTSLAQTTDNPNIEIANNATWLGAARNFALGSGLSGMAKLSSAIASFEGGLQFYAEAACTNQVGADRRLFTNSVIPYLTFEVAVLGGRYVKAFWKNTNGGPITLIYHTETVRS